MQMQEARWKKTNVYPAIFILLPDKKESTYMEVFLKLKAKYPKRNPKLIKIDYEAAVINASKEAFPNAQVSGCSFHFNQCLWRRIQHIGLAAEYRDDEDIRKFCKMCAALAYLPPHLVEDAWLFIMADAPKNEKVDKFVDYFVTQWMVNAKVDIQVWNVNDQKHRTNNAVEGWHSKLNHIIGKHQPNVHLLIKCLKDEAIKVSHLIKRRKLGDFGCNRKRQYVELDERINNILGDFYETGDP
ncbi:uncharacterized protein LOC129223221 [Uloborus diversus]|uniref:uncharacterized protein LOC129223221 n=1 Tax=Uloborus diversus TaxID=327109 RepID=UPI002409C048|nr:uncharacterized protein LOC129223221 [Uloborus diversus]